MKTAASLFYPLLSYGPALFNVGIAVYLFFFLPPNRTLRIFGFFVLALALWQVQDVLFLQAETLEEALLLDNVFCIGWIATAPLGFHFACRYAGLRIADHRFFVAAVYLPFAIGYRIYITGHQTLYRYSASWGWVTSSDTGIVDAILRTAVSILTLSAVVVIVRYAYQVRHDRERKLQAFFVALGILLPSLCGLVFQVILPIVLRKEEIPITAQLLTFFSLAVFVSLRRYRLFNIADSVNVEELLQHLTNIVLVLAPDGRILYHNPYAAERFPGIARRHRSSFAGELLPDADAADRFRSAVLAPAAAGQSVRNAPARLQAAAGGPAIDVLLTADPIRFRGRLQGVLLVASDVTEQVQLLEELKRSNERYDLVSRATNDMVWDWDLRTGSIYRNREGWRKLFGDVPDSEAGDLGAWVRRLHPDDHWTLRYMEDQIAHGFTEDVIELEFRMIRADGTVLHLLDRGFVLRDAAGTAVRLIGAAQDISARKESERLLKEAQLRRHQELTDAMVEAQENERRLIGAELHDNVNQILTSAALYLNLARGADGTGAPFIDQSAAIIRKAMQEVRKLSHTLIPPSLSGETLEEALRHLLDAAEQAGAFRVQLSFRDLNESALPPKLKLTVYRIVQEQLNNIVHHARARQVRVLLRGSEGGVLLRLQDDGVGFDPARRSRGVGLKNIETRAFLHNGSVRIDAAPGAGCVLEVRFPAEVMC
ncbi:MAG: PAS domain S-box protein [Chitinophagaceae bacterium]|nr:MAG: PAS domain S-box protein [Chitinophagaceae bacterium]